MYFVTESYSIASSDGRVILRANIDRPSKLDCEAAKFLDRYSAALEYYAREKLCVKAEEVYKASQRSNVRFYPFVYRSKYNITYSDDYFLSCLICIYLLQSNIAISQSVDSVIFAGDRIAPPKYFHCKRNWDNITIDSDGFPCLVELIDGTVRFQRVGKKITMK